MAAIKPFRGIRYNHKTVSDIKSVTAPPYDVISPEFQNELYERHPENVIRLILGKQFPEDTDENNRYSRAAVDFKKWQEKSTLVKDEEPAFYVYTQNYTFNGVNRTREGFIARFKLEEFGDGKIQPHENTLSKPKVDRLKLTKACKANFSPIFGLYTDNGNTVFKSFKPSLTSDPIIDFKDESGVRHCLWRVTDKEAIDSVVSNMGDKNILIADGHHRYETAVNFKNEMKSASQETSGDEAFNYVMMYLTNTESDGLSVFPTHRVVSNLTNFNQEDFLKKAAEYFDIETFSVSDSSSHAQAQSNLLENMAKSAKTAKTLGVYVGNNSYTKLTLKDQSIMDTLASSAHSKAWKKLDVSILHTVLVENVLGITEESQKEQKNITYSVEPEKAVGAVQEGDAQLVFFLNATRVQEVQEVAASGERMPQKSTYFYPKLITGLTINPLD